MVEVQELLDRQYIKGTTVTNCVIHMNTGILDRPTNCNLCQADVKNTLSQVIKINEWLNQWKDDARQVILDARIPYVD